MNSNQNNQPKQLIPPYRIYSFANPLSSGDLAHFRKVFAATYGHLSDYFHNHTPSHLQYGYPLIQYKRVDGRPVIFAVAQGVDAMRLMWELGTVKFQMAQLKKPLILDRLEEGLIDLNPSPHQTYRLHNWLALNQKNQVEFERLDFAEEQEQMLIRILTGNLLSMAKGLGIQLEYEVEIQNLSIKQVSPAHFKGVNLLSFDVEFNLNINLPNYLGLGKASAQGFGILKKYKS